ncbi:MAG TPA: cytochrome d ubiquinol oxidase subunit II, partial [Acidimicrobiia bacterium]|nr:cytochrome d ubiquinol oxidase subunit II [Acidimicrobiia bacterium]
DRTVGPVWEANHVWLIFCLVVLWTGFPAAFSAIMTTLFVPLALAALGIVLRGSGFAFRKVVVRTAEQRASGAAFAVSSVITPFCFGAVAGGLASGRVPGHGPTVWLNPTSLLGGLLAVATCSYLAAVFLTAEARIRRTDDLESWFRRRAIIAAAVAGALAIGGVFVLRADAPRLFDRLLGPALPFLVLSAFCGLTALFLLQRADPRLLRVLAVGAVGSVLVGWGVAQYPYLLGTHLSLVEAAAPRATLASLAVIFAAAVVVCGPSFALLYLLQEEGELEETPEEAVQTA